MEGASGIESDPFDRPDEFGRGQDKGVKAGAFDHLIDAEREALARSKSIKIALIKALREATGLGLREAKAEVEGYFARREARPPGGKIADGPGGSFDDLLDAERAAASREERPVNKILLIKALREASPLGLAEAKGVVEDYLRRRGGEGLPSGSYDSYDWMVALAVIAMIVVMVFIFAIR